jgi:hypothetical protein
MFRLGLPAGLQGDVVGVRVPRVQARVVVQPLDVAGLQLHVQAQAVVGAQRVQRIQRLGTEGNVIFVDVSALMSFHLQHLARLARVYSSIE